MSQIAAKLCVLLIRDNFGELTSHVFNVLTTHGRLAFPALLQRSELTTQELWSSLVVLVQQNLAFWFEDPQTGVTFYEANITGAYALVRSGKHLRAVECRFGDTESSIFADVLSTGQVDLQDLSKLEGTGGHADTVVPSTSPTTNGIRSSPKARRGDKVESAKGGDVADAVYNLLESRVLAVAHDTYFHTEDDNRTLAEDEVRENGDWKPPLKAKEKAEFEEAVNEQMKQWKSRDMVFPDASRIRSLLSHGQGEKRLWDDDSDIEVPNKRRRLANGVHKSNGQGSPDGELSDFLDEHIILRVNSDKASVAARTDMLVQLCEDSISLGTSRVYKTFLQKLEKDIYTCDGITRKPEVDDEDDEYISAPRISSGDIYLPFHDFDTIVDSIGSVDAIQTNQEELQRRLRRKRKRKAITEEGKDSKKRKKAVNEEDADDSSIGSSNDEEDDEVDGDGKLNGFISSDSEPASDASFVGVKRKKKPPAEKRKAGATKGTRSDAATTSSDAQYHDLVRQHLLLLADHDTPFLIHHPSRAGRPESWSVPFRALAAHLRLAHLTAAVAARHGPLGARVVRMLHEKGKLDEKALTTFGLVNPKPLRALLTRMQQTGHVELQEVPRDANRAPSRTIFLWGFDVERAGRNMLEDTYQAMARCIERLGVEREKLRPLLEKAERTDVVGKEAEMLAEGEMTMLGQWRALEEKIWGEVGRLDDIVMVLRDF